MAIELSAAILQQAMELYLKLAYPSGNLPAGVKPRVEAVRTLPPAAPVPDNLLEKDAVNAPCSLALRLGQPMYPNMKLVVEFTPGQPRRCLLRVDSHDRHLHAPPGSPDEAWLSQVRMSNKDLGEKIEAAWSAARLPTFKDFLREQLQARKAGGGTAPA